MNEAAYHADRSLKAKLRRRLVRLVARKPAAAPAGPMVTFAFDDVPASAAETGARVLERLGVRGTFFVAGALAGKHDAAGLMADAEALRRLSQAGHEIGCHTHGHLDLGQSSAAEALADIEANAA
ncbi:MAG: polysaccharide deacetylase family protein, partial [Caulobacteraceae bacterium]